MAVEMNKEILEFALKGMRAELSEQSDRRAKAIREIRKKHEFDVTICKLSKGELKKIRDDATDRMKCLEGKIFDLEWELSRME